MSAPWDLVVVGAGVIGLSCAFEAASDGLRVLVVDAEGPAARSSGVAAGMLAPPAEAHDMPEDVLRSSVQSATLYPSFIERVEAHGGRAGYLDRGTLLVAVDRDQAGDLEQLSRSHQRYGLQVELLTVRQALRIEPRISPRIAGGLRCADAHAVEPVALCGALVHAIEALGGRVQCGARVGRVRVGERVEGVDLLGESGEVSRIDAPRVLVAAGLGSAALVAPFVALHLRPVKGQVLHLRGERLIDRVVRTPRVYLVPHRDRLVVGASEEELGAHDQPLAGVTMDLLYEAWRVLPGIYELELEACVVGHRPCLRDGRPIVQRVGPPGLILATGHHRHGILLAPHTAAAVRALLDD